MARRCIVLLYELGMRGPEDFFRHGKGRSIYQGDKGA